MSKYIAVYTLRFKSQAPERSRENVPVVPDLAQTVKVGFEIPYFIFKLV